MKDNLYSILGVSPDSNNIEIKKAFYAKLREIGGPEKSPEEYKKIREAYDTLYNPVSRSEYDTMSSYGDEINTLVEQAENILAEEKVDYDKAIKLLKRATALGPNIGRLRNLLGKAFIEDQKPNDAIRQLEKAIEIDSENSVYWYNLGIAYRDSEKYDRAEEYLKKAIDLQPDDKFSYVALAYLYFRMQRSDLSYKTIDEAVMRDGVVDFSDFTLLYNKIQLLMMDNKEDHTQAVFEQILDIAKTPEDRRYAAWMFIKFAHELLDHKLYDLMIYLTEGAIRLDPEEESYQEFHKYVVENIQMQKEFDQILHRGIHPVLLEFVRAYVFNYGGYFEKEEYSNRISDLSDILQETYGVYPERDDLISSLTILKKEFPACYSLNPDFFDRLINMGGLGYTKYKENCPHCSKSFVVEYGSYAVYVCPHCDSNVEYSYNGYSRYGYSSSSSDTCFVATAVFGDIEHPGVLALRKWRDSFLKTRLWGRIFIKLYYRIGPALAKLTKRSPALRRAFLIVIHTLLLFAQYNQNLEK